MLRMIASGILLGLAFISEAQVPDQKAESGDPKANPAGQRDAGPSAGPPQTIMRLPVAPLDLHNGNAGNLYLDGSWVSNIGVGLQALSSSPNIIAQTGTSDASSQFGVYAQNGNSLMQISSGGGVGISSAPAQGTGLIVFGGFYSTIVAGRRIDYPTLSGTFALDSASGAWHMQNSSGDLLLYAGGTVGTNTGVERVRVTSDGKVGIGMTPGMTPGYLLDVNSTGTDAARFTINENSTAVANNSSITLRNNGTTANNYSSIAWRNSANAFEGALEFLNGAGGAGAFRVVTNNSGSIAERLRVSPGGNVGIGEPNPTNRLHVAGNIFATGSITGASVIGATYQDVAEWVPISSPLAPGTVVVLNRERRNEVMPSSAAYDMTVAGIVSAQPGIILGEASSSKAMIATTGRVKARVDASRAPIRIGDLLVTSDRPGMAMRSEPIDVGGVKIHRPGTLIGKALEPLEGGEGEILVLLSLQ